ncbi:unnamed protein product [Somion occarium]|uniref:Zn(2)-C6 fungal-type domain-containing protein n=1 Tax=Somion occarium TaxID=3059160 RepID=A0ABP1DDK5_9APHY
MTSHLPPLQLGATTRPYAGPPYSGALPDVDDSYYGHVQYTAYYAGQYSPDDVSSHSPASYGSVEGVEYPTGARAVTSGIEHQPYSDQVYDVEAARSPVSPDSWYQADPSYHYPSQAEGLWTQQSSRGDAQATLGTQYYAGQPYSQDHIPTENLSTQFSPMSDAPSGDVNSYAQRQDVHDYQYQYQHQSPLNYHYEGPYSLPTPPTSSEHVPSSTPEIAQPYRTTPESVEVQQHAFVEHRRSRPGDQQLLLAQRQLGRSQSATYHEGPQVPSPRDSLASSQDNFSSPASQGYSHLPSGSAPSSVQYFPRRQQPRSPSPMAHLPYPEDIQRAELEGAYPSRSASRSHEWSTYPQSLIGHASQVDPSCSQQAIQSSHASRSVDHNQHALAFSTPSYPPSLAYSGSTRQPNPRIPVVEHPARRATAPTPSRSPPPVEDTPKKPLTLACLFCRKRKIACGSPPPGHKDRTCNQCARRSLTCVYPVTSRRGMRPRGGTEGESPEAQFHMHVPVDVVSQ